MKDETKDIKAAAEEIGDAVSEAEKAPEAEDVAEEVLTESETTPEQTQAPETQTQETEPVETETPEEGSALGAQEEAHEEAIEDAETTASEGEAEAAEGSVSESVSQTEPDVDAAVTRKRRKGFNQTSLIITIVCTVVVIACIVFVGFKQGWFSAKQEEEQDDLASQNSYVTTQLGDGNKVTIGDYTNIEISESAVEISDDSVQEYLDSFYNNYQSDNTASEDTSDETQSEDTDTEDSQEAAEGDAQASEEGEDEGLTDDFVKEYSLEYFGEQFDTVTALSDYIRDTLYDRMVQSAAETALSELVTVEQFDRESYNLLLQYAYDELDYYVSYYYSYYGYSYDADSLAYASGYTDADQFAVAETEQYLKLIAMYDKLTEELGLSYTDDELDESIAEYMEQAGYGDEYTVDEFKETNGEAWVMLHTSLNFEMEKVVDELMARGYIKIVEDSEETTEESASGAETDESETSEDAEPAGETE